MRKALSLLTCILGSIVSFSGALQISGYQSAETIDANTRTRLVASSVSTIPEIVSKSTITTATRGSKTIQFLPERIFFQGSVAVAVILMSASNGLEISNVPVAESLVALACGVVAVSAVTSAIEKQMSNEVPTFDPKCAQRFDQSTFSGRFLKMILGCDPRLLLYNEQEVRQYLEVVKDYKNVRDGTMETDRMLWEAKRISDSALHPETEEWVPRAFRMSGYIPYNGPICVAMIASQSTGTLLFWSWLNQSQNALVNYYNKSASSQKTNDNETLLKSYAVAVGSALALIVGLENVIQTHFSGEEAAALARFISFPSGVVASCLNCFIIRSPELESGVPLLNEKGEKILLPGEENSSSQIAAKRGVYATTASRAIMQVPTYFVPPLLLQSITPLCEYVKSNPSSEVPITTFLLLLSFGIGLPMIIGLLPQMSKITVEDAEESYQNLGYKEFYYDKGL